MHRAATAAMRFTTPQSGAVSINLNAAASRALPVPTSCVSTAGSGLAAKLVLSTLLSRMGEEWIREGAAGDMARTSSDRKGRSETGSGPDLLTPLPTAAPAQVMETAEVRRLVKTIEELKTLVADLSRSFASGIEDLRQVTRDVSTSIQALPAKLGQSGNGQAGRIEDIQVTQTAIQRDIEDLAVKLAAGEDARNAVLAHARELQGMREDADRLTRAVDALTTETARRRHALEQAGSARSDLHALDAWRDDFIRHVDTLLATAKTAGGVQAAGTDAGKVTTPGDADRVKARTDEAFDAVVTTLKQHGESLRRNENFSLLTRKGVESLTMAFDRSRKEYRLWRLAWVSPLILLLAFAAGMLLESNVHWFYTWLSGR